MDVKILANFIKMDVEVLVGGVWIEGHLGSIAGTNHAVTLLSTGLAKEFYGPTACHAEVIQAIRQVKKQPTTNSAVPTDASPPAPVRSGFETAPGQGHPGSRFVKK